MSTTAAQLAKVGRKTGLSKSVRQFFTANPDEELTYEQIEIKFGCDRSAAKMAVRYLMMFDDGLESVHVVRLKANGRAT